MKKLSVLNDLGLFAVENFFDRNFCVELLEVIKNSTSLPTPLPEYIVEGIDYETDNKRPRVINDYPEKISNLLTGRFNELIPRLKDHFQIEIDSIFPPYFSIYQKGNFLGKHADGAETFRGKKTKIVSKLQSIVFLNDYSEEVKTDTFQGGILNIYGLIKNDNFKKFGYPIKAKTGDLIVFPSRLVHEVTTIEGGTRFTLNTSFCKEVLFS